MKASEDFINIYNDIDNLLTQFGKYDRYVAYAKKVKTLSGKDARLKLFKDDLLSYGELRNAIVHNSIKRNEIIAEPHKRVVDRFRYILEQLKNPDKVYPRFSEQIILVSPASYVNALLKQMQAASFVQVPVFEQGKIVDIINCQTVVRWLADNIQPSGNLDIDALTVKELVPYIEYKRNFRFISKAASLYEAYEVFVEHKNSTNNHLDGLFISENGDENSKILGLITLDEIVGALGIKEL
jgi:predicted transcriptional regulator